MAGQLQSYKDPYGQQINYARDKAGRLNSVTGSSFGDVTTYANNPQYRAWGALKSLSYGDQTQMEMTYDGRLQADTFHLTKATQSVIKKNYDYYADGSLKYVQDELNPKFDRLNIYDHTGRIKDGKSSAEARGGTVQNAYTDLPYRQSYVADAFGNMTQRTNLHWGRSSYTGQPSFNLSYTFVNNRVTNAGWEHDADGRVTKTAAPDAAVQSAFNAAGQLIALHREINSTNIYQDGDGREIKREKGTCLTVTQGQPCQQWSTDLETRYFLRSSVLDKRVISEANYTGKKAKTFVLADGTTLARQEAYDGYGGATDEVVYFQHEDASGMSQRTAYSSGLIIEEEDAENSPVEADPLGGNVGITSPYIRTRPPTGGNPNGSGTRNPRNLGAGEPNWVDAQNVSMTLDGQEVPHQILCSMLRGVSEFDLLHIALRVGTRTEEVAGDNSGGGNACTNGNCPTNANGNPLVTVQAVPPTFISVPYLYTVSWSESGQQTPEPPIEQEGLGGLLDFLKQVLNQYRCDQRLARIFGGPNTVMATAVMPRITGGNGNASFGPFPRIYYGESPESGVAHLLATKDGRGELANNAFTPLGYSFTEGQPSFSLDETKEPQNFRRFFYAPGSLSSYGYEGGLIVNFTHIGPADENRNPAPPNPNVMNNAGSILVGTLGGFGSPVSVGGSSGGYNVHSHMIFNMWNGNKSSRPNSATRIDPRKVFCNDLGF